MKFKMAAAAILN